MKFLKEWSLLFIICFSSFLKASADQAAEATLQAEVTEVAEVTVDDIWNQVQLIRDLSEDDESMSIEKTKLLDLYTRFVDPGDPNNVGFDFGDLLKFFSKRDFKKYVTKARKLSEQKREKRKREKASHFKIEKEFQKEFQGAESLPTGGGEEL